MKRIPLALIALSILAIGITTSCSSATTGNPRTDNANTSKTSQPTTSKEVSTDGPAPDVPKPLNVKPYLGSGVCYILSAEQAQSLGFYRPRPSVSQKAMGPACGVSDHSSKHSSPDDLSVGFQPRFSLDDIYKRKSSWSYFTPGKVKDYPYVIGSASDDRPDGYCTLHLAVTNSITSDITYYRNYDKSGKYACRMTKKTAGEVVKTLKNAT